MGPLYQTFRSVSDVHVFVLCRDGTFYESVPAEVRKQGPWQGNRRGAVEALKPEYRLALARRRLCAGEVRARGVQPGGVRLGCTGFLARRRISRPNRRRHELH